MMEVQIFRNPLSAPLRTKAKRGGARAGSGRKSKGGTKKVTLALCLTQEVADTLRRIAESRGMSVSAVATEHLEEALGL